MRFAKINEAIWSDSRFNSVTDSARLFFIYLLSCSKCNSIGIFQIGMGMMEDEFGHERSYMRGYISELEQAGLVRYEDGWMYFNKYLRWNVPTSPNHARRCAADLNDVIKKGAPKGAVCSFLGSVMSVLGAIKYKSGSGERSYYDEFKSVLDIPFTTDYLGGEEAYKNCLLHGTCGIKVAKHSESTDEVLPKGSGSTGQQKETQTQYKHNTSTRQDNTKLACTCSNSDEPIKVICSDGQPHAVGQASVRLVAERNPQWDMNVLRVKLTALTMADPDERPRYEELDRWFTDMSSHFDGTYLNLPQIRFSARKGEITPPATKKASEGSGKRA